MPGLAPSSAVACSALWVWALSRERARRAIQLLDFFRDRASGVLRVACDVAGSLTAIKRAIADVNEFIASTAAAVEEQSIVTQDMASNLQRASAELAV